MRKYILSALLFFSISTVYYAQDSCKNSNADSLRINALEKRINMLERKLEEDELAKIISEAEKVSNIKSENNNEKIFRSGQRALQAINPEISVTGDAYGKYNVSDISGESRGGMYFRVIGLHIQSNLDPFSLAKVALEFTPEGFELGEAYLTWTNLLPNISMTAGKFRQQFGILNRWHKHSLDQFDFPLPVKTIFGNDGLNQIGVSFNWLLPSFIGDANSLIVEITNGQNDNLFAGTTFNFPATLFHFKNYWDLSRNTYLELGFTGMYGKNSIPIYDSGNNLVDENNFNTWVCGADLTLFWEPVNKALYNSITWRSEIFLANKEVSTDDAIKTFGAYTYIQYKFSEQWEIGTRLDYTQPFELNNESKYEYQIVPYITWWQSHWVKLRLQYNYLDGNIAPEYSSILRLQLIWAVGPHKHDRY